MLQQLFVFLRPSLARVRGRSWRGASKRKTGPRAIQQIYFGEIPGNWIWDQGERKRAAERVDSSPALQVLVVRTIAKDNKVNQLSVPTRESATALHPSFLLHRDCTSLRTQRGKTGTLTPSVRVMLHLLRAPDAAAIFAGATDRPPKEVPHELAGLNHDAEHRAPTTTDEDAGLFIVSLVQIVPDTTPGGEINGGAVR